MTKMNQLVSSEELKRVNNKKNYIFELITMNKKKTHCFYKYFFFDIFFNFSHLKKVITKQILVYVDIDIYSFFYLFIYLFINIFESIATV